MVNKYNDDVIVLCEEHYNPLGIIRTLGEAGIRPTVVIKRNPLMKIASKSRYIGRLHFVDNYDEALSWIIANYSNCEGKTFILTSDDVAVRCLEERYNELKDSFAFFNAGSNGRIAHFQNKEVLYKLAEKHGMRVARVWRVKKGEIPDDIEYPIITKPIESYEGWKSDYYICNDESELSAAYGHITSDSDLLLQRFVKKVTERTYEGCSIACGKEVLFAIEARYTYTLADSYSMEMTVANPADNEVEVALRAMFAEIGFEGIFEVEFMEDADGKLWFLEINFRNSTWSWAPTKVGMPLPIIWMNGMRDGRIPDGVERVVPDGYRALTEQPDFHFRVRRDKLIGLFDWLKAVKTADCLYFYDRHDWRPCFTAWWCVIGNFVKRKLGLLK